MKKLLCFFAVFLLGGVHLLLAQGTQITGKVTGSEDGLPIPGVSIVVKGTTMGTLTDNDGTYRLTVPETATALIFSFVGYTTQDIPIDSRLVIDVIMVQDVFQVEEVLVVAYGTATKGTFTGSAAQVKSDKIELRPISNVTKAIEGIAPGIQTIAGNGQPGSVQEIRIRGYGSINASSDPLYIVDGVPYELNISNLNPNDIESISLLKDAASAALYGNRAANGVVMITTKKGSRDRSAIQVKVAQGFSSRAIPEYERVDARQYYPLMWESYRNSLVYGTTAVPMDIANQIASGQYPTKVLSGGLLLQRYNARNYNDIKQLLGYNPFTVADTAIVLTDGTINEDARYRGSYGDDLDWQSPLMQTGLRSDVALTLSGGGQKNDYFISLSYLDEKGFLINTDYNRVTGRININAQPKDWFKTGLNLSGTMSKSNNASDGSSTGYVNPFFFSRTVGPIYPVYAHLPSTGEYVLDQYGNKIFDLGNMIDLGLLARPIYPGRHVVAESKWNSDITKRNVISARTYADIIFLKDFKFTTNLSIDANNYNYSGFENKTVGDGAPGGRLDKENQLTTTYNFNQLLTYSRSFGDHNLDILLGHESYSWNYSELRGFKQELVVDGIDELINYTRINDLSSLAHTYRSEGYFSRLNYNYREKYFLSSSYRRDGSSKFAPESRWGDFWSVGGAWRLDQEEFIKSMSWINMVKLRASYGEVGNDGGINRYAWQAQYGLDYNNANEGGFLWETIENRNLVWEASRNVDVGLEFGILNFLSGTVEFFHRKSDNLLFDVPLPLSSGLEEKTMNIGTMFNQGLELSFSADIIKRNNINWNVNVNMTTFRNEITKLPQKEIIDGTKKLMVGHSIYDYWLRDWWGVDSSDGSGLFVADPDLWSDATGRVIDGDSLTTSQNSARYHYAGSAIPDLFGGITNTVRIRNLEISFMFTYSIGGLVYDAPYAALMHSGSYGTALHKEILNRWQKPGDVTDVPRLDVSKTSVFGAQSDRFLVDASYLNLRALNISYTLPGTLAGKIGVQNATIYLSGENLWWLTARKGMNVQQNFTGVTSNVYTPAKVVSIGLNISL